MRSRALKRLLGFLILMLTCGIVTAPAAAEARALHGKVLDAEGRAVWKALVVLVGTERSVETGSDGSFQFSDLEAGTFGLEVVHSGFAVQRVTVDWGPESDPVEISLKSAVVLDEISVTARHSLLRDDPIGVSGLDRKQIAALPHFGNDLFRAVRVLPGVSGGEFSSEFSVRGGPYQELLVELDGLELFEPFHLKDFQSVFSIVDPEIIDGVELIPGSFPAEYGDRMTAVLDMSSNRPGAHHRLGISLSNAWYGQAGVLGNENGGWQVSLRRGYLDVLLGLVGDGEEETEVAPDGTETRVSDTAPSPKYWDAYGEFEYDFSERQSGSVHVLAADDKLDFSESDFGDQVIADTGYGNINLWLNHQYLLSDRTVFTTHLSGTRVDRDRRFSERDLRDEIRVRDRRETDILTLKQDWSYQPSGRHFLKWGGMLRSFDVDYDYESFATDVDIIDDSRVVNAGNLRFARNFSGRHYGVYLSDRLALGSKTVLEAGGRLDRHTLTDETVFSPRVNLVYDGGTKGILRLGAGIFHQSHRANELSVEDGETSFAEAERAFNISLGYEATLGGKWQLRADGYFRRVGNPRPRFENLLDPFVPFPELEDDRIRVEATEVIAKGIELFLSYRGSSRSRFWASYVLSSIEEEIDGVKVPRYNDQTHALTLNFDYRLSERWHLNAIWTYHTGWPTTALSATAIDLVTENGEAFLEADVTVGPSYGERLDDYHRLDLRVSRDHSLWNGKVSFYADIQNVYNRRNLRGFDLDLDRFIQEADGSVSVPLQQTRWLGIVPSVGVSFRR